MMDEIEMDRQKALQGWDRQSCAEWETFLDEMHDDAQEPAIQRGDTDFNTEITDEDIPW